MRVFIAMSRSGAQINLRQYLAVERRSGFTLPGVTRLDRFFTLAARHLQFFTQSLGIVLRQVVAFWCSHGFGVKNCP